VSGGYSGFATIFGDQLQPPAGSNWWARSAKKRSFDRATTSRFRDALIFKPLILVI
jgi:hypothetical protein